MACPSPLESDSCDRCVFCRDHQRALILLESTADQANFFAHSRAAQIVPHTCVARRIEDASRILREGVDILVAPGSSLAHLESLPQVMSGWPTPELILIGPTAEEQAKMRNLGMPSMRILPSPLDYDRLASALESMMNSILPLKAILRQTLGHSGLRDLQHFSRWVLLREALARSGHNRHQAARWLEVSRPAVQQMIASLKVPGRGGGAG